ncbi:MAG: hypothetical protein AB1585_13335 [Thermodesulfobacteriota bacterium]
MTRKPDKSTLLEKAKGKKIKGKYWEFTDQDVELTMAWLRREITNTQADYAYKVRASQSLKRIARCLREMYGQGKMVVRP